MNAKIENIITKFLTNQATAFELEILEQWVENSNNQELFNQYVKLNYVIGYSMKEFNSHKLRMMLREAFIKDKKEKKLKRLRKIMYYSAAAVVLGIISTTYFYRPNVLDKPSVVPEVVNNPIITGTDKAILTLEDGSDVALEKNKVYKKNNVVCNGKELVYDNDSKAKSGLVFNYLTIPRGGQFQIKLADGTKVWLNSESKLKFPVAFAEGSPREVELIYGEAFFDVSPSTEHKGAKFIVSNKNQEVEVLGTEFNIKAYKDEDKIYTTLVEGKVTVSDFKSKKQLMPNQQLIFNLKNGDLIINKVDAYNEVLWTKGIFSFKSKNLKEIMTVMSRWYDVEVVFENAALEKVKFNGVLSKNDNIKEILTIIKKTNFINAYEIKDQKIIIK